MACCHVSRTFLTIKLRISGSYGNQSCVVIGIRRESLTIGSGFLSILE